MATLSASERRAMETIRALFGRSSRDVRELFESIGISAVISICKGERIVVPFVGEIEMTERGVDFSPSAFLARCAAQIRDGTETDAEAMLMSRFRALFKERAEG